MTGASSNVGSVITKLAVAEGYNVHALSRTETSDAKLRSFGAVPIRRDLILLDVLCRESAVADVVTHLATTHTIGVGPDETVMPVDIAAVDAIADAMTGTGSCGRVLGPKGTIEFFGHGLGAAITYMGKPASKKWLQTLLIMKPLAPVTPIKDVKRQSRLSTT